MENILLPSNIEVKEGDHPNHGIIEISPCYYGYGNTLGNALRRVLLSSLPGAAVTAIKIIGAQHEFQPIENVAEDSLEILLNFKKLRLKIHTDEPVRLKLKKKGKGDVLASDIEKTANVEVVNGDLKLATITDAKTELEIEIFAQRGRGYVVADKSDTTEKEIGVMAMDAIYTPVVNVGYKVENVRVGEITDYDKLILSVETDGSITPKEAVAQGANILIDYFSLLTGDMTPPKAEETPSEEESSEEE